MTIYMDLFIHVYRKTTHLTMASQSVNLTTSAGIEGADKQTAIELLRFVYAVSVESEFRKKIIAECCGCETDHPSQVQHTCLDSEDSWGPGHRVFLYTEAEYAVKKGYIVALFVETARILKIDSNLIININATLEDILESWEREDFNQIDQIIVAAPFTFDLATLKAARKINTLESRFSRSSLTD